MATADSINKSAGVFAFIIFAIFIYACSGSKKSAALSNDFPGEAGDSLVASLERTRCFGVCPHYSIKIYRSGYVLYEGYEHVPDIGRYFTRLSAAQLSGIGEKAEAIGYFNLENEYRNPHLTDFPTIYIEVRFRGKQKKITHYDASPPKQLVEMENYIDSIFTGIQWQKHPVQEIKE